MSEFKPGDKVRIINDRAEQKGSYSCHGRSLHSEHIVEKIFSNKKQIGLGYCYVYPYEIELVRNIDVFENIQIKETRRQIDVTSLVTAKTT